ncbi:hypothetical protein ACFFRR_003519 [Megaselia abdita]
MTTEEKSRRPKGITLRYLEKIIQEYHNDETLKVKDFEIKPSKGLAFHYGGLANKVYVTLHRDNVVMKTSLIVKEPFHDSEDGILQLENEMALYKKVLPILNNKVIEVKKGEKVCPNLIAINDTNDFIIMEDSSLYRYNFSNSKWKMDLSKMKVVVKQLAYLHSSSAVYENRNPGSLMEFHKNNHKHLDRFYEIVRKSLEKSFNNLPVINETVSNTDHFNCLVHGSVWEPNILFKLENSSNEDLKSVVFINYHYGFYGSPAIDLQKFIHSVISENSQEIEKELVEFYYYELNDMLQRMVYKNKIPSLEEFWSQYREYRIYGLQQILYINPFVISGKIQSLDLIKGFPSESLCDEVFKHEEVVEYLKQNLK